MTWFHHGFLFTLDEFKAARATVGRMEAKVFQEKNAMNQLQQSEALIERAKQDYQQANNSVAQQAAIAQWQTGIDQLIQLPPSTLAAEMAVPKLKVYNRDLERVSNLY
jgi:glutaredoxin 2